MKFINKMDKKIFKEIKNQYIKSLINEFKNLKNVVRKSCSLSFEVDELFCKIMEYASNYNIIEVNKENSTDFILVRKYDTTNSFIHKYTITNKEPTKEK